MTYDWPKDYLIVIIRFLSIWYHISICISGFLKSNNDLGWVQRNHYCLQWWWGGFMWKEEIKKKMARGKDKWDWHFMSPENLNTFPRGKRKNEVSTTPLDCHQQFIYLSSYLNSDGGGGGDNKKKTQTWTSTKTNSMQTVCVDSKPDTHTSSQ